MIQLTVVRIRGGILIDFFFFFFFASSHDNNRNTQTTFGLDPFKNLNCICWNQAKRMQEINQTYRIATTQKVRPIGGKLPSKSRTVSIAKTCWLHELFHISLRLSRNGLIAKRFETGSGSQTACYIVIKWIKLPYTFIYTRKYIWNADMILLLLLCGFLLLLLFVFCSVFW